MRLTVLLALIAAVLTCVSSAGARTEADTVPAYKARVNAACRQLTAVQLRHIRAMQPAVAAGDTKSATAIYGAMISDGYKGTKALLRLAVPVGARAQMKPILQLLGSSLGAVEQALRAKKQHGVRIVDEEGRRARQASRSPPRRRGPRRLRLEADEDNREGRPRDRTRPGSLASGRRVEERHERLPADA